MEEGEFLASLVKSVQAMCQGYVPFSSSIEVVGHLQLHIDQSLRLDCVLTEQVDRSPADHAPRFCSLSYLAKPPPAQHHSDSGHRTSGSSLPIDSVDRTSSSCLPIDSVDRTLGSSLPIDSVDRTSGSSLPIDSVDRTSGSSPPTDSVDRTVGSSPPIDSVDRNSGSSPPTDSASCVASSTSRRKTHQVPRIDDSESFNFTAVSQPSSVTQKKARSRGSEQVQRKDTPQSVQRKNVSQVVQRTDTSQIVLRTDVSQFVPRMDVSQFLPRTDMSQFVPRMDVSQDSDSHRITDQDPQQAVASLEPGSGDRGQKRSAAFLASPTKQRRLSADVKEEPEAELIYIKEEAESNNDAGTEDLPEQDPSPDLSRVTVESVDHSAQHEVSYMAGEDLHNTQPGDGTAFMAGDAAQTIQIQPYPVMLHAISKASLTAVAVPTPSSSTPTPVPSTSSGVSVQKAAGRVLVETYVQTPYTAPKMMPKKKKRKPGQADARKVNAELSAEAAYPPEVSKSKYLEYTLEDLDEAIELVHGGVSVIDAALRYGIPRASLFIRSKDGCKTHTGRCSEVFQRTHMSGKGGKRRAKSTYTPETMERAISLVHQGVPVIDTAILYDIPRASLFIRSGRGCPSHQGRCSTVSNNGKLKRTKVSRFRYMQLMQEKQKCGPAKKAAGHPVRESLRRKVAAKAARGWKGAPGRAATAAASSSSAPDVPPVASMPPALNPKVKLTKMSGISADQPMAQVVNIVVHQADPSQGPVPSDTPPQVSLAQLQGEGADAPLFETLSGPILLKVETAANEEDSK